MKKPLRNLLVFVCILSLLILGRHLIWEASRSADNLPALDGILTSDLEHLKGYRRETLISVWGKPFITTIQGEDEWTVGDCALIISYDSRGRAEEISLAIP